MSATRFDHAACLLALGLRNDVKVWRANAGTAWQGSPVASAVPGVMALRDARAIRLGVRGMGDVIGVRSIEITPEMVGSRVGVIVSIECKSGTGRPSPEQTAWAAMIRRMGGIAGIARSAEEAHAIIDGAIAR